MSQVSVTDRHGGEHLERYPGQTGDILVADGGYGYRRSVAWAVAQQADLVVRIHPATFPLETAAGSPFNVWRWLCQPGQDERQWEGWCQWQGQRYRVRLIAAKLDAAATQRARCRQRRKAQKAGRTLGAATLALNNTGGTSLTVTTTRTTQLMILFNAVCSVDALDDTTYVDIDILVDGVTVPPSHATDNALCTSAGDGELQHWVSTGLNVVKTVGAGTHMVQIRGMLQGFTAGDCWRIDDLSLIVLRHP